MKKKNDGIDVQGQMPGFYFYCTDYLKDLRPCSPAAKGIWMDFLCYMHFAKRRGFLETPEGRPYTESELARMAGSNPRELRSALAELERCSIYSKDDNGVIFNRRMVRDTEISKKRKAAGKKGGNPALNGKPNPQPNPEQNTGENPDLVEGEDNQNPDLDNQKSNQKPLLSSSSSSSFSPEGNSPTPFPDPPDISSDFEALYASHPKKGHRTAAERLYCEIRGIEDHDKRLKIASVHGLMRATEKWRWKGGSGAPYLDEWLLDRGYEYPPDPEVEQKKPISIRELMRGI